ncbi:MAG: response regulator [Saprospiraceae bacterium]
MSKILVVDDELDLEILIKQKFRKQIREKSYEFYFARNGVDALNLIAQNDDIDLVLSDINMPEMDGLALLKQLPSLNPILKAVMVSAYGDMNNIRLAMNNGAYDFLTKPIDFQDLEFTISKTLKQVDHLRMTMEAIKENNILKMYVDENVLNFMTKKKFDDSILENEYIDATVVFIDICGFTKISESESPDNVVKLLNNYFDIMVKAILNHTGQIDKFMGDAVMAIFKGDFHLDRAIEASLSVRNQINELN